MEYTMRTLRIGTFLPLALGLALDACNRSENISPTANEVSPETIQAPKDPAFAKEAYAIKSGEKDPAKIKSALRELRSRYGYPVMPEELPASKAVSGKNPGALGKAAASEWTLVRALRTNYFFAHSLVVSVPANALLRVSATQVDGGTDPMVLGFYKSTTSTNSKAYLVKFVGYNDDIAPGNLNSNFSWTNRTGSAQSVRLVSWSYPGTYGTTTLSSRVTQNSLTHSKSSTMWVSGAMEPETGLAPSFEACTGPLASRVIFTAGRFNPPTPFGSSLVAFNKNTMEGAFFRDTEDELQLNDVLPSGSGFLLGYFEGDGYQPTPMDFSNATQGAATDRLLNDHYHGVFYQGSQQDRYDCP
jgi:hypothetical protein